MPDQDREAPKDPKFAQLKARGKSPNSVRVLNTWIAAAARELSVDHARLAWLVASTVVIACLQRVVDAQGRSIFLLKGGTYLQHRLNVQGRATKDVDGLVRGDIDDFLAQLDEVLKLPWGTLTLTRVNLEVINAPTRMVKPRRFDIAVELKGTTWRRIQVEVAADEGGAGDEHEELTSPQLEHFGIDTPEALFGIALRYQIAQKLHACSDPHDPPTEVNDRARDLADLVLLHSQIAIEGVPSRTQLREACEALFEARAQDAIALGRVPRRWPCAVAIHPHWQADYHRAATDAGIGHSITEARDLVNRWITEINAAQR